MSISGNTMNIDAVTVDGKDLKTTIEPLTYHNWGSHNSIYRGKNLGTAITAEQIQAIRKGTFADLYVGDYWTLPIDGTTNAIITGCNIQPRGQNANPFSGYSLCVWLQNVSWLYAINDTNTTEGHLKNSKLYTETFPALLAKIETVIDPSAIKPVYDMIADSTDANGTPNHYTYEAMKLFLPSARNLNIRSDTAEANSAYDYVSEIVWPYAFYRPAAGWGHYWLDCTYTTATWLYKRSQTLGIAANLASISMSVYPYIFIG